MRPDEYMDFDGVGLAELVRGGETTASELAHAAIARIESVDRSLNAVVQRAYPAALEAARSLEMTAPLCGVPFLAKDMNIDVAGCSSRTPAAGSSTCLPRVRTRRSRPVGGPPD